MIGPWDGCDEALGVELEDVKRDDGQGVIGAHLTYESMHPGRTVKCEYETKIVSTKTLMIDECRNDEGATAASNTLRRIVYVMLNDCTGQWALRRRRVGCDDCSPA